VASIFPAPGANLRPLPSAAKKVAANPKISPLAALLSDPPQPSDVALFLHTSGTTSRPKGVPLTHGNLALSLTNIAATYELTERDCSYLVMPLFHVHGLMAGLLAPLAAGSAVSFPAAGRFAASTFWFDVAESKATFYTAVPTMHQVLLSRAKLGERKAAGSPRLRFVRSCSSALAAATLEKVEAFAEAPCLEAYAMTEASHQMTSNPLPKYGARRPGTVGRPQGGVSVAVLSPDNTVLTEPGQIGEICIRGDNVTAGYLNNPQATQEAFAGGWFHTVRRKGGGWVGGWGGVGWGDGEREERKAQRKRESERAGGVASERRKKKNSTHLSFFSFQLNSKQSPQKKQGDQGFLDAEGYVTLTGRLKELINRGGEKISPIEVDGALLSHPAVAEAVSFGAPDEKYGEIVAAAVVLVAGARAEGVEASIREHASKSLAAFKVSRVFFLFIFFFEFFSFRSFPSSLFCPHFSFSLQQIPLRSFFLGPHAHLRHRQAPQDRHGQDPAPVHGGALLRKRREFFFFDFPTRQASFEALDAFSVSFFF